MFSRDLELPKVTKSSWQDLPEICCFLFPDTPYVMFLSSKSGQTGDQAAIRTPELSATNTSYLSLRYFMQATYTDQYSKLQIFCTFHELKSVHLITLPWPSDPGWSSHTFPLPPGSYSLTFVGTMGEPLKSDLAIADVQLVDGPESDTSSDISGIFSIQMLVHPRYHSVM